MLAAIRRDTPATHGISALMHSVGPPVTVEDDPRWTPIERAHERLTERIGNAYLTATDLNKETANGRVRSIGTHACGRSKTD
jgi:hypothetical protein